MALTLVLPEVAIADWRLVLIGLGALCYCFLVAYFTGQAYQLRHIPTSSSNIPLVSYLGAIPYSLRGKAFVDDCFKKWPKKMFRVPDLVQWIVIASEREVIAELLRAPESTFSGSEANDELVQMKYTLSPALSSNPYHFPILQNQLRRALPQLVPDIHAEVAIAFMEYLPVPGLWTPVKFSEIIPKILCRASNRVFVGYPLCRDPDFLDLSVRFTFDLVKMAFLLRSFPKYLRPFLNSIISPMPKQKRKALKHLGPIFDVRRKERELSKVDNEEGQPLDMITWLMDTATGKETTNEALTDRILAINFGAIHTSSMTFTHAIYYLASYPAYVRALRKEVEAIIRMHGWSKAGLDMMVKVDSFIRESQRMHALLNVGLSRVALKDYTFSDGTYVPRGTTVAVNLYSPHFDESIYENSGTFIPGRFLKEKNGIDAAKDYERPSDMTTTSNKFLAFGNGRHACPGRFLAAAQLKVMMAYVLMNYDVKFEKEGVRPPDLWLLTSCIPNPNAKILFRRRLM